MASTSPRHRSASTGAETWRSPGWVPFSRKAPPKGARVLVTNNLKACEGSRGWMSHVWIGWPQRSSGPSESFPNHPEKGSWLTYTDDNSLVQYLTHWHLLPAPRVQSARK